MKQSSHRLGAIDQSQIENMVNELVEAKIKHIMDPEASDDSDFEDCGDNINKAI